tara:strand:- start:695 stop:1132 length:438 start_codon:yes stop_codon:yes gene_type:complete
MNFATALLFLFFIGFLLIIIKKPVKKNTSNEVNEKKINVEMEDSNALSEDDEKNTNEEVEETNVLSEAEERNISSLFSCPDCKKEISINADACPHCGAITELKKKKNSNSNLVKVIFILAFVIIAIWAFSTYQSNKYFYIPSNVF